MLEHSPHSPRNISLTIAYDGTHFCGWQIQPKKRTVEGVLREALRVLHSGQVTIIAAGRTDSGVHAKGQLVNFISTNASIPASKFKDALNAILPRDVRILNSKEMSMQFNARRHATRRIYSYYLMKKVPPWRRNYCSEYSSPLSITELNRCAAQLIGTHNFAAFSALHHAGTPVCTIYSAYFVLRAPVLLFQISANRFLWKMVRTIIGTITRISACSPQEITHLLSSATRTPNCITAPPQGLFLERVCYG